MIHFDGNRWSVPPQPKDTTVMVRADTTHVRVFADGSLLTSHDRCYDRNQRLSLPDHRLAALRSRSRKLQGCSTANSLNSISLRF
jgi:hypothetical protein